MADDLYSLLMAADEPTAAEQAQAMAAAIRGQQRMGQLGVLTGDKVLGGLGQQMLSDASRGEAQLGDAAGTRLQRALQRQQMAQQAAAQQAESQHRTAQLGLQREEVGISRQRLAQDAQFRQAQIDQENWSAQADPVSGGIVMYNKKTGEVRPLGPGGGQPAPAGGQPGPLPGIPGKPTDAQRKNVLEKSTAIAQLDLAIGALKGAPEAYGGTGNYLAALGEQLGGTPAQSILSRRYKPEELKAKNQISNVVSAIINQRAGANVTYREELRQKFLPQDTDSYDQALQKLSDLREFEVAAYEAQANGMVPDVPGGAAPAAEPAAAPVLRFTRDKSGKLVRQP